MISETDLEELKQEDRISLLGSESDCKKTLSELFDELDERKEEE